MSLFAISMFKHPMGLLGRLGIVTTLTSQIEVLVIQDLTTYYWVAYGRGNSNATYFY